MRKIKKKTVIKILIVVGAILFLKWYSNPERRIFAMVERNLEKYEIAAQQMLSGEIAASGVEAPGVRDVDVIMGEHIVVDFFVTGYGLAPSGGYYGFYYSPEDLPMMYMDEMAKLTEYEPDAWTWQGVGDNDGVIKKIADCWYYYEATF
ncbi:MAG: hypothetical protein E7288_10435 [Lachnospiraceae bacterium]|nr:hypothetical protein [Lachnospiraceae bacterium]